MPLLLVWCSSAGIIGLIRFFLLRNRQGRDLNSDGLLVYRGHVYFLFTLVQGLVWGVGGVVLLTYTSGFNQVLILLLIAGMSAGAIPLLGAVLPAYTGFLLSATIPVLMWLASRGGVQYTVLSLIGCIFVCVCFIGAKRFNGILTASLLHAGDGPANTVRQAESGFDNKNSQQEVEREVRERVNMEQVITTLSAGFVRLTGEEIDDGIDQALSRIGSFAGVDRSYIYLFDGENDGGKITHQWCKTGVSPRVSPAFHQLRLSMSNVRRGRGNYLTSSSVLPVEAVAERDFFARDQLKSWFTVPLITDGKARGFLGFDALESEIRWNQDAIALLRIAGTALMNAVERKRDEAEIHHQASQDPLTSLPNRRLFMDQFEKSFQERRRYGAMAAILFIDVDYFKSVNDSLGHGAGDSLLRQIAQRLRSRLSEADIACRLGGDEFIVLLGQVGGDSNNLEQSALSQAKCIHSELSLPYEINGQELNITVSMGVELFPSGDSTPENIISNADTAMYKAKDSGRNIIRFFRPDIHRKTTSRLRLHKNLRGA